MVPTTIPVQGKWTPYCLLVWPGVRSCVYTSFGYVFIFFHKCWRNLFKNGWSSPSTILGGKTALAWVLTIPLWTWDIDTLWNESSAKKFLCLYDGLPMSYRPQYSRKGWSGSCKSNCCGYTTKSHFWFDKNTKRKASLVEYCTFRYTEYRQIKKHVNTRWLSLERAVQRVLQQFDPLKSYFLFEGRIAIV